MCIENIPLVLVVSNHEDNTLRLWYNFESIDMGDDRSYSQCSLNSNIFLTTTMTNTVWLIHIYS